VSAKRGDLSYTPYIIRPVLEVSPIVALTWRYLSTIDNWSELDAARFTVQSNPLSSPSLSLDFKVHPIGNRVKFSDFSIGCNLKSSPYVSNKKVSGRKFERCAISFFVHYPCYEREPAFIIAPHMNCNVVRFVFVSEEIG
jgi:hypothetical protein